MQDPRISRRSLLLGSAVLGAGALAGASAAGGADEAFAEAAQDGGPQLAEGASADSQYGFLVNTARCTGCEECVKRCRAVHETPDDVEARRKVVEYTTSRGEKVTVSTSCMHCEDPACVKVCPAGAISKGAGGIVTVDLNRCIGCKYCYQACPFSVPHYTSAGMDKCDCCISVGVKVGEAPNCVQACKFHALHYGVISELEAASNGKAKRIECPTKPSMLIQ